VLAVGDAEFQKKCLGKMKDVSEKDGRTVLFVSHNMLAIKNICQHGIFLKNGLIHFMGDINDTLNEYMLHGRNLLNDARYFVDIYFVDSEKLKPLFVVKEIISFDVEDDRDFKWVGKWIGTIRPKLKFNIQ
jgi:lipopolysaccharide transport system ATP-binding protein